VNDSARRIWEMMLVIRCQAGDDGAFEELMRAMQPRLSYFVERRAGGGRDAGDLLQDVWIDVYRRLPSLKEPKAFRAWLYRIVRNRIISASRRVTLATRPLPEGGRDEPAGPGPETRSRDSELLHRALHQLSPEHREVLVLRFLEGMGNEEIAVAIDCPEGTVRSRIHYAKRALRRAMEDSDHDEGR